MLNFVSERNIPAAIGERQTLPEQTKSIRFGVPKRSRQNEELQSRRAFYLPYHLPSYKFPVLKFSALFSGPFSVHPINFAALLRVSRLVLRSHSFGLHESPSLALRLHRSNTRAPFLKMMNSCARVSQPFLHIPRRSPGIFYAYYTAGANAINGCRCESSGWLDSEGAWRYGQYKRFFSFRFDSRQHVAMRTFSPPTALPQPETSKDGTRGAHHTCSALQRLILVIIIEHGF